MPEATEVVLGHPGAVVAHRLRLDALLDHVQQEAVRIAPVRAVGRRIVGEGEVAELHDRI